DADVGLDDAPVVEDQRVRDHDVDGFRRRALALAHAVAYDLAAAELDLVAVDRRITLDLDDERRVAQADAVARRRAEHVGIGAARDAAHESRSSRSWRSSRASRASSRATRACVVRGSPPMTLPRKP